MQKQCSKCSHDSVCKYKDAYAEMIDRVKALVPEGQNPYPVMIKVSCVAYMENKPITRDIIQQQTPFMPVPLNPHWGAATSNE